MQKKIDTILFDLDGTLLPMEQEAFVKRYIQEISKVFVRHGLDAGLAVKALWAGTHAMVRNDGSQTNEDCFWQTFCARMGEEVLVLRQPLELFYEREFDVAKEATGPNPLAVGLVRGLADKGYRVAVATNPVFPMNAVRTRLGWLGLAPEDFAHVTTYTEYHACKPNPAYFKEVLHKLDVSAERCLMVGNDLEEDGAAQAAGIEMYVVTDCLIDNKQKGLDGLQHGSFAECCAYLNGLEDRAE